MFAWTARNWGHLVGATLAAMMLVAFSPIVFGAGFGGSSWNATGDPFVVFDSNTGEDTTPVLNFALIGSGVLNGTTTITGTDILIFEEFSSIDGNFAGVQGGNTLTAGSMTITVYSPDAIGGGGFFLTTPNNMFNSGSVPSSRSFNPLDFEGGDPENPLNVTIVITINFNNAQFQTSPSTNWAVFNFN